MEKLFVNADGELANMSPVSVMISSDEATELEGGTTPTALSGLPVGSEAYTCGGLKKWRLDTDGETWVEVTNS